MAINRIRADIDLDAILYNIQYKKPKNEFLLTFIILYEHLLYSL